MIVPVILAAGESRRMGYPKALLPLGSGTFLSRILETIDTLKIHPPLIVLGAHAHFIKARIADPSLTVLENPVYALGQFSSMKLAVRNLPSGTEACLIWPVDHPAVSPDLIRRMIKLFRQSSPSLVLPEHGGSYGHPALFGKVLFAEILDAPVEGSPKAIVSRHRENTRVVHGDEAGTVMDIDTPEDYRRLTGESLEAALARSQAAIPPSDG